MQQIMAYETNLLEYDDLFDSDPAVDRKVAELKDSARHELANLDAMGGAISAIEYMKSRLVESNADRLNKIETNTTTVVGVNRWTDGEPSPLMTEDGGTMVVDPTVEQEQINRLKQWRQDRDKAAVTTALVALCHAASKGLNVMPPSIAAAKAGATTGEWAAQMRTVFGEYRGPTGVSRSTSNKTEGLEDIRNAVDAISDKLGRRLKFSIGKPGLDGHSNGAEQITYRARDCGMDIAYEGIRLTPEEIIAAVQTEACHVIGLSILSGSHIPLLKDLMARLKAEGLGSIPVIVGGIIPDDDAARLKSMGVARVYTPKDFELNTIMLDIVALAEPGFVAAE
jgi:(2R)-ethylmalonyl-CoA mutase